MVKNSEYISFNPGHAARLDHQIKAIATTLDDESAVIPQANLAVILTETPTLIKHVAELLIWELLTKFAVATNRLDLIQRSVARGKMEKVAQYKKEIHDLTEQALTITAFLRSNPRVCEKFRKLDIDRLCEVLSIPPCGDGSIEEKVAAIATMEEKIETISNC